MFDIHWSVENPGNSYLWCIEEYALLREAFYFVEFHSCIHGSERKKYTAFLTSLQALQRLSGWCQGDYEHLSWGYTYVEGVLQFDTAKEAAYPRLLCQRFAAILAESAHGFGLTLNPSMEDHTILIDPRVATLKQPRGRKVPPIISEFLQTKTVRVSWSDEPCLDDKQCTTAPFHGVPTGSKLLRTAKGKRGLDNDDDNNDDKCLRVFGIFRDMMQFTNVALGVSRFAGFTLRVYMV